MRFTRTLRALRVSQPYPYLSGTLMTRVRALLLGLLLAAPLHALATVYKCVDDRGRTTYTNDRSVARNCKPMSTDQPVSTVAPLAPAPSSGSSTFPSVSSEEQNVRDSGRRAILETELKNEEASLESAREALREQEALYPPEERNAPPRNAEGKVTGPATINGAKRNARLQPYINQVELHERNIESLKREMSRLR
jgi:hypothetical protein